MMKPKIDYGERIKEMMESGNYGIQEISIEDRGHVYRSWNGEPFRNPEPVMTIRVMTGTVDATANFFGPNMMWSAYWFIMKIQKL